MILEIVKVFGLTMLGAATVAVILRLIFGKNLTVKLWFNIMPGIILLVIDAYIWKMLGGVNNIPVTLITVPIGTGLMVVNLIYFGKTTIARINKVVDILKDIAEGEGDLTKRITVDSKDEVGELARWFNLFVEKNHSIIKTIAENAKYLNDTSTDLSGLSAQMSDGAENMTGKSNVVATSAEEMSSNISSVAASMEEASINISMVATAIEELTSSVGEIARNTENARNETNIPGIFALVPTKILSPSRR